MPLYDFQSPVLYVNPKMAAASVTRRLLKVNEEFPEIWRTWVTKSPQDDKVVDFDSYSASPLYVFAFVSACDFPQNKRVIGFSINLEIFFRLSLRSLNFASFTTLDSVFRCPREFSLDPKPTFKECKYDSFKFLL